MKPEKLTDHPDVLMIYQDRESVEPAISQIMELNLDFKAYKYHPKKLPRLAAIEPKVLMLSSNNVKNTIELYIEYLEEYQQHIAPHCAILLVSNAEASRAFLACENGLFDNYAIINPLNEPHRIKLVLLQELQLISKRTHSNLELLVSEGEDELASCIEHGLALKKTFLHETTKAEENIITATEDHIDNSDAKSVLQNLVGLTFEEMNENVSANIDDILKQLLALKKSNHLLKKDVEKFHSQKDKTVVGVNKGLLTKETNKAILESADTACFKVLIAEPSDLFTNVIDDIFSGTAFKYKLVNHGQDTLTQINMFKPDVVLLAYDLPVIGGIDITKRLREEGNNVPIIAYIHHKDRAEIKTWQPHGLSGKLIKPSRKSAILQSINKALKEPVVIKPQPKVAKKKAIEWQKDFSVGNKEIDEQHQTLFDMLDKLFRQEDTVKAIIQFNNLSSYIDLHFDAEENLLRQINYPETESHINLHNELREKFHVLRGKVKDYDIITMHRLAMFLYNWLENHILKHDMSYKAYAISIEEDSFMN